MYVIAALTKYEIENLKATRGGLERESARANILAARSGFLPNDWQKQVVESGLLESKMAEWNSPANVITYEEEWELLRRDEQRV